MATPHTKQTENVGRPKGTCPGCGGKLTCYPRWSTCYTCCKRWVTDIDVFVAWRRERSEKRK